MNTRLGTFVALSFASAALACAQGCAGVRQSSQAATHPARQAAASAATPTTSTTPYAPPFPARKRGGEAFEPFIRVSGGRRFESDSETS